MKHTILLIGGPSTAGKSTAAYRLVEKLKGTSLVLGSDLLLTGEEGALYKQYILRDPGYQELLGEFYGGKRVDLFQTKVRDLLRDKERVELEAKFEALLHSAGETYKNIRLSKQVDENFTQVHYLLLDVLDPTPLAEILIEKGLPVKVAFLYVPFGQYLKRLRRYNQEAQTFEKQFCDPFGLILRYSNYFVLSPKKSKRSVEKLSIQEIQSVYDQAVKDFKELFGGMVKVYRELELKDEALQIESEIELLDRRKEQAIKREIQRLNPDKLEGGFLNIRSEIKANLYLNTDQLSTLQVEDKLMKLISRP